MSLIAELKRRNVFRVAAAYLVVGWLLTEVLTTILPTLGAPGWAARVVILIFAFGFIPTIVLSWVYELTPDGIKREQDVDRKGVESPAGIRKLDYLTIVAVLIAIVFVAVFSARQSPENGEQTTSAVTRESVAVLPFVNMSSDEDNEYFSDGLTDTLLHMLAQTPGLKVAARTSSFAFKGKNMNIREIADALQVAHVLEGSVQLAGNRVRVIAQLIRASDGFHVWSQNYDRPMDDIFGIQDEIAEKVGSALSASLLGPGASPRPSAIDTDSTDAYDMYLQALKERATFSYGGLTASEQLLKGALLIDPGFVAAKMELASNYMQQYETGLIGQDEALAAVLAMTEQVLAVQPDNVTARSFDLFGRALPQAMQGDSRQMFVAIEQLEAIVAEHPGDYQVRILLSRMLQGVRQLDKALQLQLDARELDPYNARIHYEIGARYLDLDQLPEARDALQKSLSIEPNQPNAYLLLAMVERKSGDGLDYLRHYLRAMEVDPRDHEIPGLIAAYLYQLGLIEEGDDFRDRVMAVAPASSVAYRIALLRALHMGDEEASVLAARRAVEADIEDRHFAFGGAVQYLLRRAARLGTVAEESAWLEEQVPGILDIDADAVPAKFLMAQGVAFDAWYTVLTEAELLRRLDRLLELAASFGFDPLEDPRGMVGVLAMKGETEEAIELALTDVFTEPVVQNLNWQYSYKQSYYDAFRADPRVAQALQQWEEDTEQVRSQVKSFLESLTTAS